MSRFQPIAVTTASDINTLRKNVELAFNRLVTQLNHQTQTTDVDVKDHRIRNVAWPVEWHDAVNIEYLMSVLPKKKKLQAQGALAGTPGTVTFTPYPPGYGQMGLRSISVSGNCDVLHVVIPFVDETETSKLWLASTGSIDGTSTAVTISSPIGTHTGTNTFAVGDFVVFDDPAQDAVNNIVVGTDTTNIRSYEVDQITALSTNTDGDVTSVTLQRKAEGTATAYFKSFMSAHEPLIKFYKAHLAYFAVPTDITAISGTTMVKDQAVDLPSACVVAVAAACDDNGSIGTWKQINASQLAYPFLPGENPAPGYRTCNGAEYLIPLTGLFSAGQSSPVRLWVGENASIRDVVANVTIAPTGTTNIFDGILGPMSNVTTVVYVLYVEPLQENSTNGARRVAVLEQLAFRNGEFSSFNSTTLPAGRRIPYLLKWPTLQMPVVGTLNSLYDSNLGSFQIGILPLVANGDYIYYQEGGELDAIIANIGNLIAGANMTISVMT